MVGFVALGFVIVIIVFLRMRNTPENLFNKARKHHKIGEEHYRKGDIEEAELHYEMAKKYREEAMEKGEI